jgi:iron complex transport system substrate-binding protein
MHRALRLGVGLALALALALGAPASATRVASLDQCADQFTLALADPHDIVALSNRADDADAYLAAAARGHPLRRVTLEALLAARPTLVLRYWGGDPHLTAALQARGVRVVTLDEATDFAGVRRNVRAAAAALGAQARGEALIRRMDARLMAGQGAWRGRGGVYLTSGGYSAGPGSLIDAMLRGAGFANQNRHAGFSAISLEQLVLNPPAALALGFFDPAGSALARWSPGRHRVVSETIRTRPSVALPASILACPAWFAADGVTRLAAAAPR